VSRCPVSSPGNDDALPEHRACAPEDTIFLEEWSGVNEHVCGSIVVMKADYRLETNGEIREGVDLLTLAVAEGGEGKPLTKPVNRVATR